ncbi:MAG: hypothetical protein ABI594_06515 [Ginsengibacter sp.]
MTILIFMLAAVMGTFFLKRYSGISPTETKKELLVFFSIFLAIITIFTIDLISHFTPYRLLMIVLISLLSFADYHRRFRKTTD